MGLPRWGKRMIRFGFAVVRCNPRIALGVGANIGAGIDGSSQH